MYYLINIVIGKLNLNKILDNELNNKVMKQVINIHGKSSDYFSERYVNKFKCMNIYTKNN